MLKPSILLPFFCSVLLPIPSSCIAQITDLVYVSVQGTWNKTKDPSRAQFASNNRVISTYFETSDKNLTRAVIRSGSGVRGLGELTFRVKEVGTVDSLVKIKGVNRMVDEAVISILESMSGKWVVGKKDGVKQSESVRMWYSVYKGPMNKKELNEFLDLARHALDDGNYKEALKHANSALHYVAINTDAISIKAQALAGMNRINEACELVTANVKFNIVKLDSLAETYCKKW